jgi:hypothetical protein
MESILGRNFPFWNSLMSSSGNHLQASASGTLTVKQQDTSSSQDKAASQGVLKTRSLLRIQTGQYSAFLAQIIWSSPMPPRNAHVQQGTLYNLKGHACLKL